MFPDWWFTNWQSSMTGSLILPENVLVILQTSQTVTIRTILSLCFQHTRHSLPWTATAELLRRKHTWWFLNSRPFLFWSISLKWSVDSIHVWRSVWRLISVPVSFSNTVHQKPDLMACLTHSPSLSPRPSTPHPWSNSDFCFRLELSPTPTFGTNLPPSH